MFGNNNIYYDDELIPSKQREMESEKYTNQYLKRVNFRTEMTQLISGKINTNDIKSIDLVLKNAYYEDQLANSTVTILSNCLKLEIDRVFGKDLIDIVTIKNIVSKYF